MENENSDKSSDEPNPKRQKMETEASTSSKPEANDPSLSVPPDIIAKIIANIPIAQWPSLETLDKNFWAATLIAYRQLRNINVERDLLIKFEKAHDRSKFAKSIKLILQKLVERSPFLMLLGGVHLRADAVPLLAQFEHLQSISLGDGMHFVGRRQGIQLENVIGFLESTRSRTSLRELRLANVVRGRANLATALNRFATSFVTGCEIQSPLKLEKFSFASSDDKIRIRLDTLDTSRLTDVRLGNAIIEPQQLASLIERAGSLRRIELSFLQCPLRCHCNRPRLQANEQLLTALASHESLTAIKFDTTSCTGCACIQFVPEFVQMLKTIGDRGQLRKLAIEKRLFHYYNSNTHMNEICATICSNIPYLQSIKLRFGYIDHQSVFNIASLPELEEIDLLHSRIPMTADIIKKLAQLPNLKRLALFGLSRGEDPSSFKYLADGTMLRDLRIEDAASISADVWDKWSNSIASNLETLMISGIKDENGLSIFLEKAARLRILILIGRMTDESLKAIAQSCPKLEILGVRSSSNETTVQYLQEVVNRCPNLKRLGGFEIGNNELQLEKYRKIVHDADVEFWKYDFEDVYD